MAATTEDRDESIQALVPLSNADLVSMPRCKRCNLLYLAGKSTSALRLTYCSFLCELGDLGFSMQGLEQMERAPRQEKDAEAAEEPALADTAAIV